MCPSQSAAATPISPQVERALSAFASAIFDAARDKRQHEAQLTAAFRSRTFLLQRIEQLELEAKLQAYESSQECAECERKLPDRTAPATDATFLLDSGATSHVTSRRGLLRGLRSTAPTSFMGMSGHAVVAREQGDMTLVLKGGHQVTLSNVYFNPKFEWTLVSVPQLTSDGYDVAFRENRATLTKGDAVCEVPRRGNKYLFELCPSMTH